MRKIILLSVVIGPLIFSFCSDGKKEYPSNTLRHRIVAEQDISNRSGAFSKVYQIILEVDSTPSIELVEKTLKHVRKSLRKGNWNFKFWEHLIKRKGFVLHLFLPEMDLEGLPYVIVQFRPRKQKRLIMQNHALEGTKWQIETEVDKKKEPNKASWANRKAIPKQKKTPKSDLAYQLATIDSRGFVFKDDPSIAVFRRLLTKLDSYFTENKQEISDATVKAQELLKKEGIEVKLKAIMEGLQGVYPYKIENQKYLDILVYYMTFRKDFQSHSEAIISLKAIIIAIIGG